MDGHNSKIADYFAEIDLFDDEIDRLRGTYLERCKGPREAIREILQSVKDADLNVIAFKILLREHRELRRHEKRVAELDLVDKSDYESMAAALGDFGATPLGDAALKKAKKKDEARVGA